MKIVRVTMKGYGCEIARGLISRKDYEKVEHSRSLDNVWFKDLYKNKVKKEYRNIEEQFHHIGLINGDIIVEVDNEIVMELPIGIVDHNDMGVFEKIRYPETDKIVLTSIQHQEGIVCDTMFITADDFDISLLSVVKKEIEGKVDIPLIPSLYCEIRYDGETVPIGGTITDLRMSRLVYDTNGKNKNR
jgi:predicted ATP-dependent protease